MPRAPRRETFDENEVGIYHCVNRCVRRAFLCGEDRFSGRSFEHRREWVRVRLEELASIFAIDHLNFSIMGNHLHVLVRNRPDIRDGCKPHAMQRIDQGALLLIPPLKALEPCALVVDRPRLRGDDT